MKTYISPEAWFSLSYPDDWEFENEENCTSFSKRNGVGALQLSAYMADSTQSARENLLEYIADEGIEAEVTSTSITNIEVATAEFSNRGFHTRLWFISSGLCLVLVTYISDPQYKEVEREDVDLILNSINLTCA
jgi:hypothetical protein